ncbi:MAG TPA: trypsin-like peptidase domain-containing protein [Thermomicrobiales bacterium]|nr:trypsin-like peptidase domain-containing protein [Thermomicrobiales bacterium]
MSQEPNVLIELSNALADAVETVARSIVTVKARRRLPATGLVWSPDGLIVTANHIVERDEDVTVVLPDGSEVAAELVGRDPSTDVAALRVEASDLRPAPKAANGARPGQIVLALGRPYGSAPQVALGAVSIAGSALRTRGGGRIEGAVRPDLTMYPGFSGGPLVNAASEVIGMNTSALTRGLPVAIPNAVLDRVVSVLLEKGRVARGYLGVALQPVRIPSGLRISGVDQETGLMIVGIEPESPAEGAGLMLGDTLVSFGGQEVGDPRQVHEQLGPDSVGKVVAVRLLRAGELVETSVTPGER